MGLRPSLRSAALGALVVAGLLPGGARAQQRDDYLLGEERRLEMVVHVLGEVARPGEYRVSDDTNVLELLSKAGGGTPLSQMSEVTITRMTSEPENLASAGESAISGEVKTQRVFQVNVDDILKGKSAEIPNLRPGDIVMVPRNSMSTWRTTAAVLRDISIVFTTYLLAVRTYQD